MEEKSADQIGYALFNQWISKFGIPDKITLHLPDPLNQAIQEALLVCLNDHPLLFTPVQDPLLPGELYLAIKRLIDEAQLSWPDFLPALQFAYNTAENSKLKDVPFQLLFGRKPNEIKTKQPSAADDFVHVRTNMFLATKKFFEKQTQRWLNQDAPNRDQFQTGQEVFFWEKTFGQTTWKGPFEIRPNRTKSALIWTITNPDGSPTIAWPLTQEIFKTGTRPRISSN